MSRQIGPTVEILMKRVRQEGSLAIDPDFATEIYSYCEQIINTFSQQVLTTSTLTIPKEKLLFHYRTEFTSAIDIKTIRDSSTGRRIEKANTLRELFAYDYDGFRNITGTRVEMWCQISRDLLILYPGLTAASTAKVTYVTLLTPYTDFLVAYNEDSQLPDEDVESAIELAEIVLLARFRQLSELNTKIKTFVNKYQLGSMK